MTDNKNKVTNPLQACTDVFIRPSEVFKALSVNDNWSWVPFILLSVLSALPAYMYFGVVDFSWYVDLQLNLSMPNASPAELDNARPFFGTAETTRTFAVFIAPISLILTSAMLALYYTALSRNDEKSIHSYFDWFGAQLWILMPTVIGSLLSILIIAATEQDSQISQAILSPTSLGFIFGIAADSKWFALFTSLRLEVIWSVYLGAVCLFQWTNFSVKKSYIVAAVPSLTILSIIFSWTLLK